MAGVKGSKLLTEEEWGKLRILCSTDLDTNMLKSITGRSSTTLTMAKRFTWDEYQDIKRRKLEQINNKPQQITFVKKDSNISETKILESASVQVLTSILDTLQDIEQELIKQGKRDNDRFVTVEKYLRVILDKPKRQSWFK